MITYKPIIIQGSRRKDGTTPVKIRVTFKGQCRRLPTTLTCTDADLTRSGHIKNATILQRAGELIRQMRSVTDGLSPFALEEWTVDDVVRTIRDALAVQTFRLDFLQYGYQWTQGKKTSTAAGYVMALHAFERFLGATECDINEITRKMVLAFVDYVDNEPKMQNNRQHGYITTDKPKMKGNASAHYVSQLGTIFAAARQQYNDEDEGRILIPRTPFDGISKIRHTGQGQQALSVEVMQRIIDAQPEDADTRQALAVFLASFALMGANMEDMYQARRIDVKDGMWRYRRAKTGCEVRVSISETINAAIRPILGLCGDVWLFAGLHRWSNAPTADKMTNYRLRRWCEAQGLEPFTFYAARHTWGTLARGLGIEKATVDEGLGHKGDYRITDIYAERNWSLAWEANEKVLALFRWPTE